MKTMIFKKMPMHAAIVTIANIANKTFDNVWMKYLKESNSSFIILSSFP